MNSINWPASNVWVFISQLVEHCSANAEVMGSNPIEAPKNFFWATFATAQIVIHCDGHVFISLRILLQLGVVTKIICSV